MAAYCPGCQPDASRHLLAFQRTAEARGYARAGALRFAPHSLRK